MDRYSGLRALCQNLAASSPWLNEDVFDPESAHFLNEVRAKRGANDKVDDLNRLLTSAQARETAAFFFSRIYDLDDFPM